MKLIGFLLLLTSLNLAYAGSKNNRYQDADYVRAICELKNGEKEYSIPGGRVDCKTNAEAIEVEFSNLWKEGVEQAKRYAQGTGLKGVLALIIEHESEISDYNQAKTYIEKNKINVAVEKYTTNDLEKRNLLPPRVCAKKAKRSNICHLVNNGSYGRTENYTAFKSYEECLSSSNAKAPAKTGDKFQQDLNMAIAQGICKDNKERVIKKISKSKSVPTKYAQK